MHNDRLNIIRTTDVANNNMNEQLSSLYNAKWDICRKTIDKFEKEGYELANPYLLAVSDNYLNAKTKIVCLGKETQCWGGEFACKPTIEELQQLYTLYIYHERGNGAAFHRLVNWLCSLSPDVAVIPNNIIKIGKKSCNGYYNVVAAELHKQMTLLKEELTILKPTLIVCPTSNLYAYNQPLEEMLGGYTEKVLQQDYFVSERRYEAFPDTPLIMCPHPQGKTKEKLNRVKDIISKYVL